MNFKGWNPSNVHSFWINHASRLIMRQFEQSLRPLGFGMAYLPVVTELDEAGPLQQKDLAQAARVEQPTMAALLVRMERDGLVTRSPHPRDKRASVFALTKKARSRMPQVKEVLFDVAHQVTQGFSEADAAKFLEFLQRAVRNLGEEVGPELFERKG